MHERTGWPSTCTVQAPQSAMPQPNLLPVSPISSRRAHSSGVSPGTSTFWRLPLMSSAIIAPSSLQGASTTREPPTPLDDWLDQYVIVRTTKLQNPLLLAPRDTWREYHGAPHHQRQDERGERRSQHAPALGHPRAGRP